MLRERISNPHFPPPVSRLGAQKQGAINAQRRFNIFHMMKGQEGRKTRDGYHTDASPAAARKGNYPPISLVTFSPQSPADFKAAYSTQPAFSA